MKRTIALVIALVAIVLALVLSCRPTIPSVPGAVPTYQAIVVVGSGTSGQYASTLYSCSNSVNWTNGNVQYKILASGSQNITLAAPISGGRYMLVLKQPPSGAAGTVTWPATVSWGTVGAPTLSSTNNQTDIIAFIYSSNETKYFGSYSLGY